MKDIKWTDIVMALFTVVIAGAAILQWREMVGAGTQNDKLVAYANAQAQSAADFADSSYWIEQHMDDAANSIQDSVDTADRNTRQTLKFQKEQMRTQTRLSVRPYVGIDEGQDAIQNGTLHIDGNGNVVMQYTIRAKNYSNVPAMNVFSLANLVVADDLNTVYEQERDACSDEMVGKSDIGHVLFQGKDRVFTGFPAMTTINIRHKPTRPGEHFSIAVFLTGCVSYRDQFGYLYRTKFIARMADPKTDIAVGWHNGPPKGPIDVYGAFVQMSGSIDAGVVPKYK